MAIDYTKPSMWGVKEKVSSFFARFALGGRRLVGQRRRARGAREFDVDRHQPRAAVGGEEPERHDLYPNWGPMTTNTVRQQLQQLPAVGQRQVRPERRHAAAPGGIQDRDAPDPEPDGRGQLVRRPFWRRADRRRQSVPEADASKNFDVSYEWYLSKTNYVSAAVFVKNVSDFLETSWWT
jgi:iron complex outermembrane receptor protein